MTKIRTAAEQAKRLWDEAIKLGLEAPTEGMIAEAIADAEFNTLNFPIGKISAKEIWKKDNKKRQLAIDKGYKFIIIWEQEIKAKGREFIQELVYNKIKNIL